MGCFFIYHLFDILIFELFHLVYWGEKKKTGKNNYPNAVCLYGSEQ